MDKAAPTYNSHGSIAGVKIGHAMAHINNVSRLKISRMNMLCIQNMASMHSLLVVFTIMLISIDMICIYALD